MTSLTFYGGINEIGGNKILLEDRDTRIFLDFGMSFSLPNTYFDEFMEHCGYKPEEKPDFNAVLLSHAHMDHSAYIHYLRDDIPIYCTQGSKDIMQALDETGSTGTTELIWLKESFKMYINKKGEPSRLIGERTKKERTYSIIDEKTFRIGDMEIEALPVSHSLEGATAYIIHTGKGPVIYTGDFRFHGYKGDLTRKFVKHAADVEPVALMIEGTRIDSQERDSENDVKERVMEQVEKTENLVVVNFPIRDTDRMISFHDAAKNTNRSLVINLRQAYLLQLFENSGISVPRIDDEHIRIYVPKKSWGVFRDDRFPERIQCMDYKKWEQDFLDHQNIVTAREIRKNQESFVFRCDFFELKELIDIKPDKNSTYIRSICEPFDIEMELDKEKVDNWLKHFGLFPYSQIHASGHLNHDELQDVIEEIQPGKLFPIHTEHPGMFKGMHKGEVILPELNDTYNI